MTAARRHRSRTARAPAPPGLTATVLRQAAGAYRRHFLRLAVLSTLVFGSVDVFDHFLTVLAARLGDDVPAWLYFLVLGVSFLGVGAALVGLTFFAGMIEQLVAADMEGRRPPSPAQVARTLPWRDLIVVDLLAATAASLAALLLVIPGLIVVTLFALAGPLVVIERRGPLTALRRSSEMVRGCFWRVAVLITVPTMIEETLDELLRSGGHEDVLLVVVADIVLGIFVGSVVGVTAAVLTRSLLDIERRTPAAPDTPTPDTPTPDDRTESVKDSDGP